MQGSVFILYQFRNQKIDQRINYVKKSIH